MRANIRTVLVIALVLILAAALSACGSKSEPADNSSTPAEPAASETSTAPAEDAGSAAPLPDEQRYTDLLAIGLDFSYELAPEDGELQVLENMEGYGSVKWTDAEGRSILVTRRFVASEPEEWTYVDEGVIGDGVTEDSPTGAQLQTHDALAGAILEAVGADPSITLTRIYAWTSSSGIGSVAYSTGGVSDDQNLLVAFGEGELIGRVDLMLP